MYDYSNVHHMLKEIAYEVTPKEPVKRLFPAATAVFPVSYENKDCILKIAHKSHAFGIDHLISEQRVLDFIDGEYGIPKMLKSFETDEYFALLKEFKQGVFVKKWYNEGKKQRAHLEKLVDFFHIYNMAHLDISSSNIIISSEDALPVLIDLGGVFFKDVGDDIIFNEYVRQDKEDLEDLFLHS